MATTHEPFTTAVFRLSGWALLAISGGLLATRVLPASTIEIQHVHPCHVCVCGIRIPICIEREIGVQCRHTQYTCVGIVYIFCYLLSDIFLSHLCLYQPGHCPQLQPINRCDSHDRFWYVITLSSINPYQPPSINYHRPRTESHGVTRIPSVRSIIPCARCCTCRDLNVLYVRSCLSVGVGVRVFYRHTYFYI